ncbi:MAG: FkbM family methyltransferase [Pseudomonadota bacterium]
MNVRLPSPYELKKALMLPRKLYMRRKENLEAGFIRSALELHYYRPAFYHWMAACTKNPDLLYEADFGNSSLVLDVGAYIGEWAEEILSRHEARVIALEPDPRNFKQLAQRAERLPQLTPLEYGVGDRDETVAMTQEFLGSAMFTDNHPDRAKTKLVDVTIRDIRSVWSDLGLKRVDLMKINIEGAEFPLLERMMQTDLLAEVDTYLIQFHEWHPGAYRRRRNIQKALSATHRPAWDYHFVWEKWVRK